MRQWVAQARFVHRDPEKLTIVSAPCTSTDNIESAVYEALGFVLGEMEWQNIPNRDGVISIDIKPEGYAP